MRIYEGSPRQDFEEVFRSIGAFLDQRGMKDVLLVEAPDGFIVQGLVISGAPVQAPGPNRSGPGQGNAHVPRRRYRPIHGGSRRSTRPLQPCLDPRGGLLRDGVPRPRSLHGRPETAGRVLLRAGRRFRRPTPAVQQAGSGHQLAEFTREDIAQMVARGPRSGTRSRSGSQQHDHQRLIGGGIAESPEDRRRRPRHHSRRSDRHPARGAGRALRLAQADRGGRRGAARARPATPSDQSRRRSIDPDTPAATPAPTAAASSAAETTLADRSAGVRLSSDRRLAEAAVLGVMVVWAANFIVVKNAIGTLPPVAFTMLRYGLAAVALLVHPALQRGSVRLPRPGHHPDPRPWRAWLRALSYPLDDRSAVHPRRGQQHHRVDACTSRSRSSPGPTR